MQKIPAILFALVIVAYAFNRLLDRNKPQRSQHLKGWQKLFGVVAVALAILIILNPEFIALGLLGDAAFFDMLVLALSLQMHALVAQACRWCINWIAKGMRWIGTPSPGTRWLMAVSTCAIASALSTIQKAVHRLIS